MSMQVWYSTTFGQFRFVATSEPQCTIIFLFWVIWTNCVPLTFTYENWLRVVSIILYIAQISSMTFRRESCL